MNKVWFNGELIEGPLPLAASDRGLMLGDGVFETIAVNHHAPAWLPEHIVRMKKAAIELGIIFDDDAVRLGVIDVLHRSTDPFEILRISLTRGVTPRGLAASSPKPTIIISLTAFEPAKQPQNIRLATSKIRRNETAPSCRLKTLSYIDSIAAAREVSANADDALMLNAAGHVACCTVGNIFILRGGQLLTPQLDQGILPGITRQKLIDKFKASETTLSVADVLSADAIFLTNSLRLVTTVAMLDGKKLSQNSIAHIKQFLETETGRT
jgi:branched-chain amino acid aminotransferase